MTFRSMAAVILPAEPINLPQRPSNLRQQLVDLFRGEKTRGNFRTIHGLALYVRPSTPVATSWNLCWRMSRAALRACSAVRAPSVSNRKRNRVGSPLTLI